MHLELTPREEVSKDGPKVPSSMLWASTCMMSLAVVVFIYEGLAYNLLFLGRILPAAGKASFVVPLFLAFNLLWGLALWSYLQAHSRDPGVVPWRWYEFVRKVGQALPIVVARPEWQPGKATFCKKCAKPRPDRAHHCRICGVCVLRMDHHCPWINNCVGFNNHKFFLLLSIYALLACLFGLASALPELAAALMALAGGDAGKRWRQEGLMMTHLVLFLLFGILALLVGTFLAHMLSIHLPLATNNSTSIEDFYENMPNPFDQGTCWANLAQTFGSYGPDWLLPIKPLRPLSDGVSYPCADELLGLGGSAGDLWEPPPQEDGLQAEQLWRLRYHVRPSTERSSMEADKSSGLGFGLSEFWRCGLNGGRPPTR